VTTDVAPGLWHNHNWRRLWAGQAVSLVGDYVFNTTVVLWVGTVIAAGRPWAPAAVSGMLIAAAVPVLLVGPVAGVYVDRWDHRRTMMGADLLRAGLVALLLLVPAVGSHWPAGVQLALVYTVVALTSATSQFFNPARFVVIAGTIHPDDHARAFGMSSATGSAAAVLGPPLAAPLLFGTGVHWALAVNVCSYLVSFVAVSAIRAPRTRPAGTTTKTGFRSEFAEGLGFLVRNRTLVVIVGAVFLYMFGVGAVNVLGVFFVTGNLHVDAGWLGTLTAALGVGSVVGAVLAGPVAKRLGEARVFAGGIALTGLVILVYSRTTSLPVAVAVLGLAGVPLAAVNVVVSPLVLRVTPVHLLGRVNAVLNPLVYLASITSMAVAGFLASTVLRDLRVVVGGTTFGPIDTVFAVSAVLMVTAGVAALAPLTRPGTAPAADEEPVAQEVAP
jgi:MFS family permease